MAATEMVMKSHNTEMAIELRAVDIRNRFGAAFSNVSAAKRKWWRSIFENDNFEKYAAGITFKGLVTTRIIFMRDSFSFFVVVSLLWENKRKSMFIYIE